MRQGEFEALRHQLLDVWTLDLIVTLQLNNPQDMDRPESGTVPGCHVLIQCLHRVGPGHLAIFFVHVMRARAGIVADPDAEILDFHGPLFVDLREGDV